MALNGQWLEKLGRHYEKLVAVLVLLGLLGSLLYLSVIGMRRRQIQQDYQAELSRMEPHHPVAGELDGEPFERMLTIAREPYRMAGLTNTVSGFFIPEARVWCVDCRRPIPLDAAVCPYCGTEQPDPKAVVLDSNRDGIPDSWYRQYGMDPFDPDIADKDWDGDGFSNRQEFEAGTSPVDPTDHPPVDILLRVQSIEGRSVTLQFRGHQIMPDGTVRCQFNLPTGRTEMLAIGDTLLLGGYTFNLSAYEVREVKRLRPGFRDPRLVQVPFVILESGDQRIELELRVDKDFTEYVVTLVLPLDDTTYRVRPGHVFNLRGNDYRLIRVDKQQESVVIRNESDGRELHVTR